MPHGPENLDIMDATFSKIRKNDFVSISRNLAIFLVFLFLVCIIGTALLVYNFTTCSNIPHTEESSTTHIEKKTHIDSSTHKAPTERPTSTSTLGYESSTFLSTTNKPKTEAVENVRLPKSVVPYFYTLNLIPFIQEGNFTFHGDVTISVNVTEICKNVTLHSDELTIKSVNIHDKNHKNISIKDIRNDKKRQFLIINLDEEITPGSNYTIHLIFDGILNDLMRGFYRSSYKENGETRWLAATQFQPTDARRAFPSFDEPALKAKFQINLGRPKNMTSISNMRQLENSTRLPIIPDYEWDSYEETLPMSTYLLAFVVSDFQKISNGSFSIWARRSAISQAKYSLEIGPTILKYYEEFFSIKYPLPKLDMVAIPDFPAGAMENWGLITFRELLLLYDKDVSGKMSLQRIAHVVSHELAHQWFGNLVTPTWWTDLWLNEGFATFVEYLGVNAVGPEWREPDRFVVSELQGSLSLDALNSSHQISIVVNDPDEVNDIFDSISYSKGAAIIRMMQEFLSLEVFHKGLHKYLSERLYGNAEQDDLWRALTEESHLDGVLDKNITVKQIMDTWTLQTGFPLITASRDIESDNIVLQQERFVSTGTKPINNTDNFLWWVPITYTSSKGTVGRTWMKHEKIMHIKETIAPSDWFLINVNQTGYYRVNYDEENWILIINQLHKENGHLVFDVKNRAQLIDDAQSLAFVGYLSYDIALNLTTYLTQEREYTPWKSALGNLMYLYDMFIRTGHFDKYKTYALKLIQEIYDHVGFQARGKERLLDVFIRNDILETACLLGMRNCIIHAVQHFQNWKNSADPDKHNSISPDLRGVIYCTAISDGGQEEWEFAWQRYLNTNVDNEQETLLAALGCSKEIWILSRLLEWSITENSGIRKHDTAHVFSAVARNPIGQELTYRFMKTNWKRIRSYLGPDSLAISDIVRSCTAHFNTQEEVDDFKMFLQNKIEEFGVALRTAQQSIEKAEVNVRWMNKYFKSIVKWLSNSLYS